MHPRRRGRVWVKNSPHDHTHPTSVDPPIPVQIADRGSRPFSAKNCREQMQQAQSAEAYSITSSARARSVGGIVMPMAVAIFRFTLNRIFAGC
jgi:hypothetical protein